uniref:Uncharacterized protein n=1 Tax=Arundo donax TaxID=35708 RepID=A0A0A8YNR2_ARUDO
MCAMMSVMPRKNVAVAAAGSASTAAVASAPPSTPPAGCTNSINSRRPAAAHMKARSSEESLAPATAAAGVARCRWR